MTRVRTNNPQKKIGNSPKRNVVERTAKGGIITRPAKDNKKSSSSNKSSSISSGTAVGSGISGGVLVTDPSSPTGTREVFYTPTRSVLRDGSGSTQRVTPTETEVALQQSLPEDVRDRPVEEVVSRSSRLPERDRTFTFREQSTVRPTAEEEFFQQSLVDSGRGETGIGRTRTSTEFRREAFFESLVGQEREFSSLSPQEIRERAVRGDEGFVGLSTPQGEVVSFTPSISRAEAESEQAFSNLSTREKTTLITSDVLIGGLKASVNLGTFPADVAGAFFEGGQITDERSLQPFGSVGKTKERLEKISPAFRELSEKETGFAGKATEFGIEVFAIGRGGRQGVKTFKSLKGQGFTTSEAIGEISGSFAPFRTTSGVYSRRISPDEDIIFQSFVRDQGKGIKTREIIGRGEDFRFQSAQAFRSEGGREIALSKSIIRTEQPSFIIQGGQVRTSPLITQSRGGSFELLTPGQGFGVQRNKIGDFRTPLEGEASLSEVGTFSQQEFSTVFLRGSRGEVIARGTVGGEISKSFSRVGVLTQDLGEGSTQINLGKGNRILTREGLKIRSRTNVRGIETEIRSSDFKSSQILPKGQTDLRTSPLDTGTGSVNVGIQQTQTPKVNLGETSLASQVQATRTSFSTSRPTTGFRPQGSITIQQEEFEIQRAPLAFRGLNNQNIIQQSRISERQTSFIGLSPLSRVSQSQNILTRQDQAFNFGQSSQSRQRFDFFQPTQTEQITSRPTPFSPNVFIRGPKPFVGFFLPGIPAFGLISGSGRRTKTRTFQRTPSLGAVLKFELTGFGGGRQSEFAETTGLVERGFGTKLPQIKLGSI